MPARRWRRPGAAVAALLLLTAARHPMHTAVAEITQSAGVPEAGIVLRVFADDFGTAVPLLPGAPEADSAMSRYVRGRFAMADRTGRPVRLRWVGAAREGDVIVMRMAVASSTGLSGARVVSALLCERFHDQINIVRATYGGGSTTLLFTEGDGPKALP